MEQEDNSINIKVDMDRIIEKVLERMWNDPDYFKPLLGAMKKHYQKEEQRLKKAYSYEEVRQLLGLKTVRAVKGRVRRRDNYLEAQGRQTNTPFILKDDLFTHCVQDLGMSRAKAFELVY